jgi:hypothetical protein
MSMPSMPTMLSPMSQSSIANLALIPVVDVAQCPINHPKAIKVAILSDCAFVQDQSVFHWD